MLECWNDARLLICFSSNLPIFHFPCSCKGTIFNAQNQVFFEVYDKFELSKPLTDQYLK